MALQIDRLEFSTNVPDAVLGENEVYVTLTMRYYGLEDDDAHTQFERTMVFSIDEATPREPKRLVNFFLDRRTDTETMEYDTRDFMKQAMSDALRSDMSAALTELKRQSSRYLLAHLQRKGRRSFAPLLKAQASRDAVCIMATVRHDGLSTLMFCMACTAAYFSCCHLWELQLILSDITVGAGSVL